MVGVGRPVYRRRARTGKKYRYVKNRSILGKKSKKGYSSLLRMISHVALRKAEPKETHTIAENNQLTHNTESLHYSVLYTQQGIGDNDNGLTNYNCRIGNEIVLRGISFKFWFATKKDRPNVMFRILVFRYRADTTIGSAYKTQGSSNFMIRDVDTDKVKILKARTFNINMAQTQIVNTLSTDVWQGKESHKLIKMWIPFNNVKLKYKDDNSGSPKFTDVGFSIVAYDSYGTIQGTDVIASYAYNYKVYFKDP